ncbi:MAG: hypothetical protein ACRC7O_05365, partial [Fimbriiglobus sp.]
RYFDARNVVRLLRKHGHRRGRRSVLAGLGHHRQYAYHRYAIERESGFPASAAAVVDGMYDAAVGRYGPYTADPRPGVGVLRWAFDRAWRWSGGRSALTAPAASG